jgi:hypothetical protein
MRIAPAGLVGGDAFQLGCDLAALTHGHPTGYVAAGFFAQLVHELVRGIDLREAALAALDVARRAHGSAETVAAVENAVDLASRSAGSARDVARLGQGWTSEEAAAIAVYCSLVARDFADGVRLAVNHSGDSDSTGALTGNLLGLVHGEEAIPRRWLEVLELRGVIAEVAEDFWRHFGAEPWATCGAEPRCGQWEKYPAGSLQPVGIDDSRLEGRIACRRAGGEPSGEAPLVLHLGRRRGPEGPGPARQTEGQHRLHLARQEGGLGGE